MDIPFFIFGLAAVALGAYMCYYLAKLRKTHTAPVDGIVVRYEEGWTSVSRIGKGGMHTVKAWFPIVTYSVNGVTRNYTCRNTPVLSEPVSVENIIIPLRYNPANPVKCVEAECNKANTVWAGPIIIIAGIVFIVISFIK